MDCQPTSSPLILPVEFAQERLMPGQVRLTEGFVADRYRANITGSLKKLDIDRFVHMLEEPRHRDWWWIGEQPGKWLESALLVSATEADDALRQRTREILRRILRAQEPGGYLGITDPALRSPAKPLRGMDPYEQYFTLHALLTACETLHDREALAAAIRLADYYLQHIGPGKAEFWPSPLRPPQNRNTIICKQFTWVPAGTPQSPELYWHSDIAGHTAHYGWEGTLIVDPILRLYQLTGESRFLDFARWVVSRIDEWSGWDAFSKLDAVAAGQLGVHQLQPYVHSHTFQINFMAFLRLYQVTGEESLLRKVIGAWEDIVSRQLYITGGVSVGEHYEPGHHRPLTGHVVETCANMSWMQLTQHLLQLTGDPCYADVIERLLFNHVFASQTVDGDSYRYHTPPNGAKPVDYFHGPDCCTSSGHRLVSMLPLFLYAQSDDTLVLNQYVPSTVTIALPDGASARVDQTTTYPEGDTICLRITVDHPTEFALSLRLPAWCSNPELDINGQPQTTLRPGTYHSLRRTWRTGDSVRLRLPMRPQWVRHGHLPEDQRLYAIQRGPVVYAADTLWWDHPQMAKPDCIEEALFVPAGELPEIRETAPPASCLGPALRARLATAAGQEFETLLLPFANVGRWYRDPGNKPDPQSSAYSYAVWLRRKPAC